MPSNFLFEVCAELKGRIFKGYGASRSRLRVGGDDPKRRLWILNSVRGHIVRTKLLSANFGSGFDHDGGTPDRAKSSL